MIYLTRHRLLFVKPHKTAGTSVEIALSCNALDDDIVTPLIEEDETIRRELGGRFPVNWAWFSSAETRYRARFETYLATGVVPRRYFGLKPGRLYNRHLARFYNHITPARIRRRGGGAMLDGAFLVTMTRHPYELVVSRAAHLSALTGTGFDVTLAQTLARPPLNDAYLFGAKAPDFVIRYEHLHDDLRVLEAQFGLSLVDHLPVTKGTARTDRRKAHEILSEAQKARIRDSHRQTFEAFGYAP